jgi:hypothetical protein
MKRRFPENPSPPVEHKDIRSYSIETSWGEAQAVEALKTGTPLECAVISPTGKKALKMLTPTHIHKEGGSLVIDVASENSVAGVITFGSDGAKILQFSAKKKGKS